MKWAAAFRVGDWRRSLVEWLRFVEPNRQGNRPAPTQVVSPHKRAGFKLHIRHATRDCLKDKLCFNAHEWRPKAKRIPINRSLWAQALVERIWISQNFRIQQLIQTESWGLPVRRRCLIGRGSHILLVIIFQFPFVISQFLMISRLPFGYPGRLQNSSLGPKRVRINERWPMKIEKWVSVSRQ